MKCNIIVIVIAHEVGKPDLVVKVTLGSFHLVLVVYPLVFNNKHLVNRKKKEKMIEQKLWELK